ncbi:MAG TPA: AtzE family amidohydrolase [Rhodopila sp.]|uniref:AtzE family amidohydrolase n=1 Tax=Rhodopila sp. TaxID=2480087 RepID=UPI002CC4A547|nr:AtzE family amidohydrolase [Rhodopila sp.]HVY17778.1 AtzE family amidohydrolase [Rhodopila sp.]
MSDWTTATAIAADVAARRTTAAATIAACLDRVARLAPRLNAFTAVTAERARARAAALDASIAAGATPGPLAGVPFAVKNLIDVAGLPTLAGSRINRDHPPAAADAPLVARLEAAGAILVGARNMGEYAYDFTGENAHDGNCRNPHDLSRMAGGSSSGSGSAVGGGLVPLALGSDTNGSIRVPASFNGVFGLKPTYGRLTRAGSFPFVSSLDHLGPLCRSVADLAASYDAMQGYDPADPACVDRPVEPVSPNLDTGVEGLRIATAGGYFRTGASADALAALDAIAAALGVERSVEIEDAAIARSAAYVITTAEGAALHLSRLKTRPDDFDADVRDRLIAGALVPAAVVAQAQKFRRLYRARVLALFDGVDAILAPATPCVAPKIGEKTFVLDGVEMPVRPNIGLYTQPISFIGLPVVAVPVPTAPGRGDGLPIGVQVIAPPWREDIALRVARALEARGVARVLTPKLEA